MIAKTEQPGKDQIAAVGRSPGNRAVAELFGRSLVRAGDESARIRSNR